MTDIKVVIENDKLLMDAATMAKMAFLYNAVDDGWTVKKENKSYIFVKDHGGKHHILSDSYLLTFVKENINLDRILKNTT